jgi:hypothetical protein
MNNVYSFLNVSCGMVGPGGILNLGSGAAAAEEGITLEAAEDKNVMTIGADGQGQHSLIASDAGTITVRLLKTSPLNQALQIMYDLQSTSAALWGQNVFTVVDSNRGDNHVAQSCAFKKKPTITYDKAGPMMEWTFDAIAITSILGSGT